MEEYKNTIEQERKIIRKILKKTYPGCRTYIKPQCKDIWNIRLIHEKFATQGSFTSIQELVELLTPHVERLMVVEPICQKTWESRRW